MGFIIFVLMRQLISYLLIGAFLFSVTPVIWHYHEGHEEKHDSDCDNEFNEDCFVCDFDYTSLSAPLGVNLELSLRFFSIKEFLAKSWNSDNSIENVSSRGPPIVS